MAATAKLELLLELKNKMKAGLGQAKDSVVSSLKDMKDKLNAAKGSSDSFFGAIKNKMSGMFSSFKGFNPGSAIEKFKASSSDAFKAIESEVPGVSRILGMLSNPYVLATAAALAFGAVTAKAVNMALDWEQSMAKINVTAQLTKPQLDQLSDKILAIGAQGSTELENVPLAFNRIISAGLDVNTSLKALQPTLKAAKAGFTDIETVAAAGVGVMNSSGEDINRVYDVLFATMNKGNAEFKDIAQYLPKIIPGAKAAGFSLSEVGGAFAFLTAAGQTAEQSSTGLMNTFKALSDPRFIEGFKKIGVQVYDSAGKTRPLINIVDDLKKSLGGLTDKQKAYKLDLVGLDMEAKGAFLSMIQNMDSLKGAMDFTENSTGQLDIALENAKTSTDLWKEGMNKVKVLAIQFGQLFLPMVRAIGEGFNWVMQKIMDGIGAFKDMYNHSVLLRDIIGGIGNLLVLPFKLVWGIISFIFNAISKMFQWLNDQFGIMDKLAAFFNRLELSWVTFKAFVSGVVTLFQGIWQIIEPLGEAIANMFNPARFAAAIAKAKEAFGNFNMKDAFDKGFTASMKESLAIEKRDAPESLTPEGAKAKEAEAATGTPVEGKVEGATQSKSIVVNIDSFMKDNKIYLSQQASNGQGMSLQEFEKMMNELALRLIRNVEASY